MSIYSVAPIDEENKFGIDEIIVSKTDIKGKLTYANDVFCRLSEMTTREVIGQPHSIIRHPDMPRAIFKLLWDTIQTGTEIFAYVKNMSKTGRYYWVIAHVTPSFDEDGQVNGYHSNRRYPQPNGLKVICDLYKTLQDEEKKHANSKEGLDASTALLDNILDEQGKSYSEFIWSLRG
ncbi:MAG: PAS domain-containing protein [Emcibacter sp.]|nr:PAS domain-containing protein [Emcibacter sp.]